jgi:hypothetical protein
MYLEVRAHFVGSFGFLPAFVSCQYYSVGSDPNILEWKIIATFSYGVPLVTRR